MILTEIQNFLTQLMLSIDWDIVFFVGIGFEILLALFFIVKSHFAYEMRLVRKLSKINAWLSKNQYIDTNNLLAFNELMKSTPKQLRHYWHQYMLYREKEPSFYMSTYNCIEKPLKTSSFLANIKNFSMISYAFAFFILVFSLGALGANALQFADLAKVLLTPVLIVILNVVFVMILRARENMNLATLYQYFNYFNRFMDKAVTTMPEYVDFEVLFTRQEIRKGIPVLNEYLEKRARQEQEELEKARKYAVEHEQYNFNDAGIDGSLVLDRAMKETETYLNIRHRLMSEIEQYESEIDSLKRNYENTQKEYQKKLQASKENVDRLRKQQEESTNRIETNYIKKQQSDEIKKQEQLEKDHDTATIRFNQEMETLTNEIQTRKLDLAERKQYVEDAMRSEYQTFSSKMYRSVVAVVEERVNEDKQALIDIKDEIASELEEANITITEKENEIHDLRMLLKKHRIDTSKIDGFYSRALEDEAKRVRRGKRGMFKAPTREELEEELKAENDDLENQLKLLQQQENELASQIEENQVEETQEPQELEEIQETKNEVQAEEILEEVEEISEEIQENQSEIDDLKSQLEALKSQITLMQNGAVQTLEETQNNYVEEDNQENYVEENQEEPAEIEENLTEETIETEEIAEESGETEETAPEGEYDENGNYVYPNGAYYDPEGRYHDENGGWFEADGITYHAPGEPLPEEIQAEEIQAEENSEEIAKETAETETYEETAEADESEEDDGEEQKPFEPVYDENGCYYDQNGNYIYPNGAYYSPDGCYHDQYGGWFEADGVTYHAPAEARITLDNIEQDSKDKLAENFGVMLDPKEEKRLAKERKAEEKRAKKLQKQQNHLHKDENVEDKNLEAENAENPIENAYQKQETGEVYSLEELENQTGENEISSDVQSALKALEELENQTQAQENAEETSQEENLAGENAEEIVEENAEEELPDEIAELFTDEDANLFEEEIAEEENNAEEFVSQENQEDFDFNFEDASEENQQNAENLLENVENQENLTENVDTAGSETAHAENVIADKEENAVVAPKRRGRPKKEKPAVEEKPAEPKRRGRPKKEKPAEEEKPAEPKRRGRPVGSTKEKMQERQNAKKTEGKKTPAKKSTAKSTVKKTNAKPAEKKSTAKAPAKTVSKTEKAKTVESKPKSPAKSTAKKPKTTKPLNKTRGQTVRKGVGRPRKDVDLEFDITPQTRRVGRPKKDEDALETIAPKAQSRGRGRPKKSTELDEIQKLNREIENENKRLKQRQKELKSQLDETLSFLTDELD